MVSSPDDKVSLPGDVEFSSEFVLLFVRKPSRAVQKLVSLRDLPSGRSMMNFPRSLVSQKPPRRASDVHTYVFC